MTLAVTRDRTHRVHEDAVMVSTAFWRSAFDSEYIEVIGLLYEPVDLWYEKGLTRAYRRRERVFTVLKDLLLKKQEELGVNPMDGVEVLASKPSERGLAAAWEVAREKGEEAVSSLERHLFFRDRRDGAVLSSYFRHEDHDRYYGGIQGLHKAVRKVLYEGHTEIDISNCVPVLLLHLARRVGIQTPWLQKYVQDREAWLEEVSLQYEGRRKRAKTRLLAALNGAWFRQTWQERVLYVEARQVVMALLKQLPEDHPWRRFLEMQRGWRKGTGRFCYELERKVMLVVREHLEYLGHETVGIVHDAVVVTGRVPEWALGQLTEKVSRKLGVEVGFSREFYELQEAL